MEKSRIQGLLFVYNADSGFGNAILDGAHKLLSPTTYECRLCALTFGIVGQRKAWKKFRKRSSLPMEFLHRDEFLKAYASKFGAKFTFPIVLASTLGGFEVLIGTVELNAINSVEELIGCLEERLLR
jgi:hypothetical protein